MNIYTCIVPVRNSYGKEISVCCVISNGELVGVHFPRDCLPHQYPRVNAIRRALFGSSSYCPTCSLSKASLWLLDD